MYSPRRLVLASLLLAGALRCAPVFSSPRKLALPTLAGWKYEFSEGALEARWSWRGDLEMGGAGEARLVVGWKDAKNLALIQIQRVGTGVTLLPVVVKSGVAQAAGASAVLPTTQGEIGLQKVGNRVRVLWNGAIVSTLSGALPGDQFGTATRGAAKLEADEPQPTEAVVFRDDFMRAEGPNDKEIPGEWKVAGVWKTSGTLGPKSDAELNPNPFVFRAEGSKAGTARAGKWWWSDYSVAASVRAAQNDEKAPLVAGIEAFAGAHNPGIRGEIDFARGVARLKSGNKVLAQSAPFDTEADQWHHLRLEPGPGTAKLIVDGITRVQAPSQLVQGAVLLTAVTGGPNHVDFDDVRIGTLQAGHEWGEGALPERFQKDRLMRNWASGASDWRREASGVWWHTGDFFGATTVQLPLPALEVGDGFQILLGADPKDPQAGEKVTLSRTEPGSKLSYAIGDNGPHGTLPLPAPDSVLKIGRSVAASGVLIQLQSPGSPPVTATLPSDATAGKVTKIGIRPLKNGQPLPPPSLQKFTLTSTTFEREGRAVIGVNITPVSDEIARRLGLTNEAGAFDASGAIVDNVEAASPAKKAGIKEGDVIRGVDGARVLDVDTMRTAVGAVKPGSNIKLDILRPQSDASGLDWAKCSVTTPNVLDYSFTAAPVDWRAARGTWEVSERWTCSPQWSFFVGQNDAAPLLWSRFATQGDWTLEAYLATPMDLARGERSPSDLNITVGGDGVDLASGYSFIFGGKSRSVNQIRRGDAVVWEKPFELPPGAGDTHQDWFYVRLERRQTAAGVHFRYSVNGRQIAEYTDAKPLLDKGHLAFWTQNGGLSIARVRLWNAGLRSPESGAAALSAPGIVLAQNPAPITNPLGVWSARGTGRDASARFTLVSAPAKEQKPAPTLKIVNPRSGGDWTTYVTRTPFSATTHPVLEWDYRVPSGVKLNLYALVDSVWREIVFTGAGPMKDNADRLQLGSIAGVKADDQWHHATFDLGAVLKSKALAAPVEALAFAAPDRDYQRAGLGGNHRGATYWLRDFKAR